LNIPAAILSLLYLILIFGLSSIPGNNIGFISPYSYLLHILEYGGFAFILTMAVFKRYEAFYPYPVMSFALAISICDEIYQSAVPMRTSSALDVMADLLGIFLGIWVFAIIYEREFFYGTGD